MTKNKDEIEEGEIIDQSLTVIETKAVNLTPKQMQAQVIRDKEIRSVITKYISENLKEGVDYGSIEIQGKKSKPTLFKPGSEKFCSLFKIRPVFRKDDETWEMLGNRAGSIAYICELYDGKGRIVGEGRGVAIADFDKKDKNGNSVADFNVNKQVKLAEKRSQIDAILRTGGLSDFFTQDIEDTPMSDRKSPQKPPKQATSEPAEPASDKQKDYLKSLYMQLRADFDDHINLATITKDEASREIAKLSETVFDIDIKQRQDNLNYMAEKKGIKITKPLVR